MLYTKPIREITYQNVVDFCNSKNPEGFILEYKQDFPKNEKLAQTIAAFANTYSGILIIGVNAPNGEPIPPFEGVTFNPNQKYEEWIQSIVLSHIKEPVFPEVQICEPINGKTFIILRVAESYLTPHRVADNTKIYIRTGQSSTPNAEAAWDKIEWLASRRKKSEELREFLIKEAETYYQEAFQKLGINVISSIYFAILTLRILPLFPQEPLIKYKELENIGEVIRFRDYINPFPDISYPFESVQNGVQKLKVTRVGNKQHPVEGDAFKYIHLNSFGLYLYKEDKGLLNQQKNEEGRVISKQESLNYDWVLASLHQFLKSASQYFKKLGYWGTLLFHTELSNVLGINMQHPISSPRAESFLSLSRSNLKWERSEERRVGKECRL